MSKSKSALLTKDTINFTENGVKEITNVDSLKIMLDALARSWNPGFSEADKANSSAMSAAIAERIDELTVVSNA